MEKEVLFEEYDEGFAVLTINRPEKMNAISLSVVDQLTRWLDKIQSYRLKFLIITGSGTKAFCAGGDLNDFHGDLDADQAYQVLEPMKNVLYKITTLPFPTIAWMNGVARGGGLEIASACDFRFAKQEGNFGFVQGKLGISTGWGGGTLLYERIHPQDAFQWLVEADIRDVQQLKEIGFIQKVITGEKIEADCGLLELFINRSYEQMTLWKQQRLQKINLDQLKEQMDQEVKACSKLWESDDHKQAVKQFFVKNGK
ncbi:enoyl-CoA hydratase/isomerase family protein [Tenuibacillus multivorans]|uniref:Ethylmalonyl-CoA decarboxylase n=1 Tax=Tenuibacillus multivorans TaxID=237069 RepID=A0A1G9Y7V6_9BACI|nr:enoyl-CoA hydratase/isomerase family protein [Tenuibacillus multivorans]GEL75981.1 enoyl-CoA hydratase [Tenuibacillus multivorans]SDN05110.1 Enoyl-CoA hydratase/carnithine racemase [Tenuibacillus multivorans]